MVDQIQNPTPELTDEVQVDAGQSIFFENQPAYQAPPKVAESATTKKIKLVLTILTMSIIGLIIIAKLAPKQQPRKKIAPQEIEATPSAKPALSGWEAEFAAVDEYLKAADLETMIAPPQTDMKVEF